MMQIVDWQRIVFARRRVIPAVRIRGAMRRARTQWLRLWRGGWIVSWESGKTRVFWKAGNPD